MVYVGTLEGGDGWQTDQSINENNTSPFPLIACNWRRLRAANRTVVRDIAAERLRLAEEAVEQNE
jgi:hypothetical protein